MSNKQFLAIAIITFLTALIWVSLNIVHSRSQVQIPPETKQLMEPISPNFDQEAIGKL